MTRIKICAPLLLLIAASCDDRTMPFAAYRHFSDGLASRTGGLLGYPCDRIETVKGKPVETRLPPEQCYRMQPARRYRGIWLDEFEGSFFFENAVSLEEAAARYTQLSEPEAQAEWLSFSEPLERRLNRKRDFAHSRMFLIEFIGRRTAVKGLYGHLGGAQNLIVVDRIESAKFIYLSEEAGQ